MPPEFNADQKAGEREKSTVTIGGKKFNPRRRTTKLMRDFRKLGREDDALEREIGVLADDDDEKRGALEDEREQLTYKMVAHLLKAKGDTPDPDPEFLEEHLDIEEVGDLLQFLMPGGQADPTAEPEPTTG
jgi:hypothetical protein